MIDEEVGIFVRITSLKLQHPLILMISFNATIFKKKTFSSGGTLIKKEAKHNENIEVLYISCRPYLDV